MAPELEEDELELELEELELELELELEELELDDELLELVVAGGCAPQAARQSRIELNIGVLIFIKTHSYLIYLWTTNLWFRTPLVGKDG